MKRLLTWNMRGNSNGERWLRLRDYKKNLKLEVMCLQECGEKPDSAKLIKEIHIGDKDNVVVLYEWDRRFLVHYMWGNNSRCDTAILSEDRPCDYDLVFSNYHPQRPAVGIRLDGGTHPEWYYSFHAESGGGADAASVLASIAVKRDPGIWYVGGDYNCEPKGLEESPSIEQHAIKVCPPDGNTYPTPEPHSEYDYMTCGFNSLAEKITGSVQYDAASDHCPVYFEKNKIKK